MAIASKKSESKAAKGVSNAQALESEAQAFYEATASALRASGDVPLAHVQQIAAWLVLVLRHDRHADLGALAALARKQRKAAKFAGGYGPPAVYQTKGDDRSAAVTSLLRVLDAPPAWTDKTRAQRHPARSHASRIGFILSKLSNDDGALLRDDSAVDVKGVRARLAALPETTSSEELLTQTLIAIGVPAKTARNRVANAANARVSRRG